MTDLSNQLRRWKELREPVRKWLDDVLAEFTDDEERASKGIATDAELAEWRTISSQLIEAVHSDSSVVISDPSLHQTFNEVRKKVHARDMTEDGSLSDEAWGRLLDEADLSGFARRSAETRQLMLLYSTSEDVRELVAETRRCVCLGLPTAAIAMSRAFVEAAVVDIAIKAGRFSKQDAAENLRMCEKISALLDRSVTHQSPLRQKIDGFMDDTSQIIHVAKRSSQSMAVGLFEQGLQIVQELYGFYRSQLRNS